MSEEEKKAIEYLKRYILPYYGSKGRIEFMLNDIILNLIEKQEKEIEYLKSQIPTDKIFYYSYKDFISKDKIREKIKKYDEWIKEGGDYVESLEAQRYALNELLEE